MRERAQDTLRGGRPGHAHPGGRPQEEPACGHLVLGPPASRAVGQRSSAVPTAPGHEYTSIRPVLMPLGWSTWRWPILATKSFPAGRRRGRQDPQCPCWAQPVLGAQPRGQPPPAHTPGLLFSGIQEERGNVAPSLSAGQRLSKPKEEENANGAQVRRMAINANVLNNLIGQAVFHAARPWHF